MRREAFMVFTPLSCFQSFALNTMSPHAMPPHHKQGTQDFSQNQRCYRHYWSQHSLRRDYLQNLLYHKRTGIAIYGKVFSFMIEFPPILPD